MMGGWMTHLGQKLREQIICLNNFIFPIASSIFTHFAWSLFHKFNPHCRFILTSSSDHKFCYHFQFVPQCILFWYCSHGRNWEKGKKKDTWVGLEQGRVGEGVSELRRINLIEIRKNHQLLTLPPKPAAVQREPLGGSLLFAAIWWLLLEQSPQEKNSTQHLSRTSSVQASVPDNL